MRSLIQSHVDRCGEKDECMTCHVRGYYRPHTKYWEGNVFSLPVHRGPAPRSRSRGGHPQRYPLGQGLRGEPLGLPPKVKVWRWHPPGQCLGGIPGVPPQTKFGPKCWTKKWKLLETGVAGGTPLAVTQEDCLVLYIKHVRERLAFSQIPDSLHFY